MNWKQKIIAGMELIKQGCKENGEWADCYHCPFAEICHALDLQAIKSDLDFNFYEPTNWEIEKE